MSQQGGQDPAASWLPPRAVERLGRMRGEGGARKLFTSDLSVNEFLLVKQAGFEPLGLVVGSSTYHIGFQYGNWRESMELPVLTGAMYHARELAMSRMEAEADQLGAEGIVGVKLDIRFFEAGSDIAEFVAIGTAVRPADGRSLRTPAGKPFTSDLSGQDLWTLVQSGHLPLSLVMGVCVYHVAHQTLRQSLKQIGQNVEMPQYTAATYDARELAMERMQYEAELVQAEGIVGVTIAEQTHVWGQHAIEFLAIGTSIRSAGDEHDIDRPQLVLDLS